MKKTALFTLIIFTAGVFYSHAQYDFAIGLRSGGTSGITLKKNNETTAIEGIVGIWNDGLSITGLYERHPSAFDVPGFHWLYGAGAHITFYEENFRDAKGPAWYDDDNEIEDGDLGLGIDGLVGLEYKIPPIPVAISISLKPFVEFTTDGNVWFSFDPGLGLKFAF